MNGAMELVIQAQRKRKARTERRQKRMLGHFDINGFLKRQHERKTRERR